LNDLEKEKALEEAELAKLEEELLEASQAYEMAFTRMNDVEGRLPELESQMMAALERETESIRISNSKDPQIEELGKWYDQSYFIFISGSRKHSTCFTG
jgi:hypothetical protein